MNRLALVAVAALFAAAPALGASPDDAAYARLRGDAQNLLTQARSLAFDGLTGAPGLLGQMQTVATSLKGLEGNTEAQALAGQLSSLHQQLQSQVEGGDQAQAQRPDAQREAVKAFRAKAGEITDLAQRAMTLAQPNSAAWPQPGQDRQASGHPVEVAGAGNALPLATRNVGRGLDAYGGLAGAPTAFDDRFNGVPQGPSPRSVAWNPAAEDAKLHDALAQLPTASRQDLSRSAHPAPGSDVLAQQRALNAIRRQQGLAPIAEDGRFGGQTQSAVCAMQKGRACSAKELREQGSGVIDQATSDKIALAAARAGDNAGLPKIGDRDSEDVRRLQRALNAKGAHLKVDGEYGAGTEKALARLTGRRSLDHKTWDDLTQAQDKAVRPADAVPLPRSRPASAKAQPAAQPPALPQGDPRDSRRGLATVYDRRQGGPKDAHDNPLCTMESYAVGGCQSGQPITIASHAVRKGKGYVPTHDGEVVQSQTLESYYTQYCASLGERCVNKTPRFVVSDSCPGCKMPDHVDLAREPGAPEIKMPIDIQFVRFRGDR